MDKMYAIKIPVVRGASPEQVIQFAVALGYAPFSGFPTLAGAISFLGFEQVQYEVTEDNF